MLLVFVSCRFLQLVLNVNQVCLFFYLLQVNYNDGALAAETTKMLRQG